jgi:hypothetical protein
MRFSQGVELLFWATVVATVPLLILLRATS